MNKKELTALIKAVATKYGEKVKCEWLSPDGSEWINTEMEVNAHFITELERGCIRNVVFNTLAQKLEEIGEAAAPLIKYLCEKLPPHVTVIVTPARVELMTGKLETPRYYNFTL